MEQNLVWTQEQAQQIKDDPYWQTVSLVLSQFDGLFAGYTEAAPESEKLSKVELYCTFNSQFFLH